MFLHHNTASVVYSRVLTLRVRCCVLDPWVCHIRVFRIRTVNNSGQHIFQIAYINIGHMSKKLNTVMLPSG